MKIGETEFLANGILGNGRHSKQITFQSLKVLLKICDSTAIFQHLYDYLEFYDLSIRNSRKK